jgi:hypothetical protein
MSGNVTDTYYEYPNAGWWKSKESLAKKMTVEALEWSAKDAFEAAQSLPEVEGKYMDEVSIYRMELKKRGGGK